MTDPAQRPLSEDQIKYMVDRFLGWRLPQNFSPDAGISYKRPNYAPSVDATPSGTNLFDATQADAMVRYMIEGLQQPLRAALIAARPHVQEMSLRLPKDAADDCARTLDQIDAALAPLTSTERCGDK